ncbi:MAG: PqqD family protein [Bacteroidales bacterium]|nr:PqqD family protein [Bacteroidales bacterium]
MIITEEIKISDNGFVFNSRTGDSFNLNPFGLNIIKLIAEKKEFEQIKEKVLDEYDISDLTFEKDFYEFCALLKHHQIILQDNPLEFK